MAHLRFFRVGLALDLDRAAGARTVDSHDILPLFALRSRFNDRV
jgi:hypothetical protein